MDQVTPETQEQQSQKLPERRFIEDKARAEIVRTFNEFFDAQKKADHKRQVFVDFVNVVRNEMGIRDNELWNVADDASYFEKVEVVPPALPTPPPPPPAPESAAQSAGPLHVHSTQDLNDEIRKLESGESHLIVTHPHAPCQEDVK